MRRIPDIAILAALSLACSELIDPRQQDAQSALLEASSEQLLLAANGPESCICPIVRNNITGRYYCVCDLDGLSTDPPPPYDWLADWPSPPGAWYYPDGSGGGSWRGGGGNEQCRPADPGCFPFKASLSCPHEITRGTEGECTVNVGGGAPFTVSKWYFRGATISRELSSSSRSWRGPLIESGEVRADILVNGTPTIVRSTINVSARRSGKFTASAWAASMSFVQGQGCLDYSGSRPHFERAIAWVGSYKAAQEGRCFQLTIDPQGGTGYEIEVPQEGPNRSGVYIRNPTWYYKGTSQIHPGRDRAYTLTDAAQRSLCQSRAGTTSVSFNTFNSSCQRVPGWSGFWVAAWGHERQHWEQGRIELMKAVNNLYVQTETCVGPFTAVNPNPFDTCVRREHERVQAALRAAASPEPTGFWNTTPWWTWMSDCPPGSSCAHVFGSTNRKF